MHLIREFTPDAYEFALSSWSWLGVDDKAPRFASCFGDMFLESAEGWWFLDTVEGTLEMCWASMDEMFAELETSEGRAEYLLEETLNLAVSGGMRIADDEVFAFLPPPAVTGTMSVDSLAPLRFAIAANLAGRIHGELRGIVPDGGVPALAASLAPAAVYSQDGFTSPGHDAGGYGSGGYGSGGYGENGFGSNGFGDNGFAGYGYAAPVPAPAVVPAATATPARPRHGSHFAADQVYDQEQDSYPGTYGAPQQPGWPAWT